MSLSYVTKLPFIVCGCRVSDKYYQLASYFKNLLWGHNFQKVSKIDEPSLGETRSQRDWKEVIKG